MKMTASELLTLQAMKYYDRQYMQNIERLMDATKGQGNKQGGVHLKKKLEERLQFIYQKIR